MRSRHVRVISAAAVFSVFLAATVIGQNQRPVRLSHNDRPRCGEESDFGQGPRRLLRSTLISFLEYSGECGSPPFDLPADMAEKSARLRPDVPAPGITAGATDDPIESELRALREHGLAIAVARRQVLAILRENNSCSAWYAQAQPNPFIKLASLHFQLDAASDDTVLGDHTFFGVYYRDPYVARTQQNVGAGSAITLNVHGAFFVSRAPAKITFGGPPVPQPDRTLHVGNYTGGSLNAQVTTLLHEFAHVVDLLPVDMGEADSALLSTQNTDVVLQHCRKQIEASPQRAIVLPVSLALLERRPKTH